MSENNSSKGGQKGKPDNKTANTGKNDPLTQAKPINPPPSAATGLNPQTKPADVKKDQKIDQKMDDKKPDTPVKNDAPKIDNSPADKPAPKIDSKLDSKPAGSTPPPVKPQTSNNNTQPPKKGGSGLALLALLVALAAAGTAGYNFLQNQNSKAVDLSPVEKTANAAEQQAIAAEKRANEIGQTVEALQNHVANQAQGLDKAEVSQLIAQALSDYAKNQPAAGPSLDDIQQMISAAIASQQSGAPSAELTQLRDNIRASGQKAEDALAQINARGDQIEQQLAKQAQQLQGNLEEAVEQKAQPQPFITALTLAGIAAKSSDYAAADKYLAAAQSAFKDYNLQGNQALADINAQLPDVQIQISKLAGESGGVQSIDNIINTLPAWPIKKPGAQDEQPTEPAADSVPADTAMQTAENIGSRILHRTFRVVKSDDSGVAWVNAHPDLQTLIRENARLDLAFARNALLLRNAEAYQAALASLTPRIEQYFDTQDSNVKNALDTLQSLKAQADVSVPDISALAAKAAAAAKE